MNASTEDDALRTLGWGLRRHAWVVLVALLLAGLATAASIPAISGGLVDTHYRATALVVATDVQVGTERLPRLVTTIFRQSTVADRAVAEASLPWSAEKLIEDHVVLEPLADNIVILVHGVAEDPDLAAQTANVVAQALVDELNRLGPDVAMFSVQAPAEAPDDPVSPFGPVTAALVTGIATVALSVAAVGALLAWRRPVLSVDAAAAQVGLPAWGALTVPRGDAPSAESVPGLSGVLGRALPERRGVVAVVAPARSEAARAQVAVLFARQLQDRDAVIVALDGDSATMPDDVEVVNAEDPRWRAASVVVVDGPPAATVDAPQLLPDEARVVVVVEDGTPRRRLEPLTGQFVDGARAGVVMLRTRRRGRSSRSTPSGRLTRPAGARDGGTTSSAPTSPQQST